MRKTHLVLSVIAKLLCLVILLSTVSCNFIGKLGLLPKSSKNGPNTKESKNIDQKTIKLALNGQDEIVNNNVVSFYDIDFTLENQSNQAANPAKLKAIISLRNQKNFDGKKINEGRLVLHRIGKEKLLVKNNKKVPLSELLGKKDLAADQVKTIKACLVDIDNLASAEISLQIKDQNGIILGEKVTKWKSTKQVGPIPGKSKIKLSLDNKDVYIDFKKGKWVFPVKFKNLSDHPIDLKKVTSRLVLINDLGLEVTDGIVKGRYLVLGDTKERPDKVILDVDVDSKCVHTQFLELDQHDYQRVQALLRITGIKLKVVSWSTKDKETLGELSQQLYSRTGSAGQN